MGAVTYADHGAVFLWTLEMPNFNCGLNLGGAWKEQSQTRKPKFYPSLLKGMREPLHGGIQRTVGYQHPAVDKLQI